MISKIFNYTILGYNVWGMIGTILVILLFLIIPIIVYRKNVIKLMTDAENGVLSPKGAYKFIDSVQRTDWDERMVLVVATLISKLPIINIIVPTKLLARILNYFVQKTFDSVKDLLLAKVKSSAATDKTVAGIINDTIVSIDALIKYKIGDAPEDVKELEQFNKDTIGSILNDLMAGRSSFDFATGAISALIERNTGIRTRLATDLGIPDTAEANRITSKLKTKDTSDAIYEIRHDLKSTPDRVLDKDTLTTGGMNYSMFESLDEEMRKEFNDN